VETTCVSMTSVALGHSPQNWSFVHFEIGQLIVSGVSWCCVSLSMWTFSTKRTHNFQFLRWV